MFKLCKPLKTLNDVYMLNIWLSEAWVNLAMGKLQIVVVPKKIIVFNLSTVYRQMIDIITEISF